MDSGHATYAVGLLLRSRSLVARDRQVHLPGVPGPARRRCGLVHAALPLHVTVPLGPRAVHPDADADVVGCRAGRLGLLGRNVPVRRRGARVGGDVLDLRGEAPARDLPPGRAHALHDDGPDDPDLLPTRCAVGGVRDARLLVRARSRHLQLHADADRHRAPHRSGRRRVDGALHDPHPLLLPAAARHGQLRVRAIADGRHEEARVEVHHSDGDRRAVRDVLRGHVPLPRADRCPDAVDLAADGHEDGPHVHAGAVGLRLDRYPWHDVVPVRPVRNAADAGLHLAPADRGRGRPARRQPQAGAGVVAAAGGRAEEGDRLAPRQEGRDPRLPGPAGLADRSGRPQLRHGPGGLPPGVLAALQGRQGDHADVGHPANLASAAKAGHAVSRLGVTVVARLVAAALLSVTVVVSAAETEDTKPQRATLFVGVDTSGSFRFAYDDALTFLAYYLFGHMHELGGLAKPRDLFVTAIGGRDNNEPKAFHPIHDFNNKDVKQIEADLKKWFPPTDNLTDFNA